MLFNGCVIYFIDKKKKKETVAVGEAITPKRRNPNPSRGFKWTERDQELLVDFFHVMH